MKDQIRAVLGSANTLLEVRDSLLTLFRIFKNNGYRQMGYVSGIITSDGPEFVERNIERLAYFTEELRGYKNFPIFSATDVFSQKLFERLDEMTLETNSREEKFIRFWRDILESGFITDIFMTPRWEESKGAKDEYKTAKRLGLKIHLL